MNLLRNKFKKDKGNTSLNKSKKIIQEEEEYKGYHAVDSKVQIVPFTQQMSCSEFLDLRKIAQKRIQEEMLAKIKPFCTLSPDFIILVLDSHTANMVSNLQIDLNEMYKRKVFQVEDLNKTRKRYPMTDVIYFIMPDVESIDKVIADFPKEDEIPYDQYGQVHLAFTGHCPESFMEKIVLSKKLCQRVGSFVEVNVDFNVLEDNIFLAPQVTNAMSNLEFHLLTEGSSSPQK